MTYNRADIQAIVRLAFKGIRSAPFLLNELRLSQTELEKLESIFQSEDVLHGLEVIFNGIVPQKPPEPNPLLEAAARYPIEYLKLSARPNSVLARSNRYGKIQTVADLLVLSDLQLCSIRGINPKSKSLQEIKCKRERFIEDFNAGRIT